MPWTPIATKAPVASAPAGTRREIATAPKHHAHGPGREQQSVDRVADADVLLQVEDLGGDRRAHEHQRDESRADHDREHPVAKQVGDSVAGPIAILFGLGIDGHRRPAAVGSETGDRHGEEGRGIEQHRDLDPAAGGHRATDQRADDHADIARGLDPAVDAVELLGRRPGRDRGDQRELSRRIAALLGIGFSLSAR